MKATLEFELPDEKQVLDACLKANDVYRILTDIQGQLRQWSKYGMPEDVPKDTAHDACSFIYQHVCAEIATLGIEE